MEKKYKVLKSKFLGWYFTDKDDAQIMGHRIRSLMLEDKEGSVTITANQIFQECGYVPHHIIENFNGCTEEEIYPDECELIHD